MKYTIYFTRWKIYFNWFCMNKYSPDSVVGSHHISFKRTATRTQEEVALTTKKIKRVKLVHLWQIMSKCDVLNTI